VTKLQLETKMYEGKNMGDDGRDESGESFITVDPLSADQLKAIKEGLDACRKALEDVKDEISKQE